MNKPSYKNILIAGLVAVVAVLGSPSALAQTYTYTNDNFATDSGNWNDMLNWDPNTSFPNAAGANVTISVAQGGTPGFVTISGAGGSVTVGSLSIGTSDSTVGGSYTLQNDGGTNNNTLTLDNNGSGATITELHSAVGDTISVPLVLADDLTITNLSNDATAGFSITGGITGTGNLTVVDNAANGNSGSIYFENNLINNVGTVTFSGSTVTTTGDDDTIRISGGVGANVTSMIQNSAVTDVVIASPTTVNASGTTFVDNGGAAFVIQQGISGTGDVVINNNTANNDILNLAGANNVGTVTSDGTGTGHAEIDGNIGSNVTALIVQAGATSGIEARGGSLTINTTNGFTTLEDDSNVSTADLELKQGTTGTGNLVLEANGSASITLGENEMNNTGEIINQGTGSGGGNIDEGGPSLGANLTAVVEDSTTSSMDIRITDTEAFTGAFEVQAGTLQLSGDDVSFSTATKFIAGDTKSDGAASILALNLNSGTLTMTAVQSLSGFGTVSHDSVATVSGSAITPGSIGNIGTLTLQQSLTLAAGTNLTFRLGTAGLTPAAGLSSMLAIGGTLTLTSGLDLNLSDNADANGWGSLGVGDYELMSYNSLTGATLGDITSLFDVSAPAGFDYALSDTSITGPGEIDLDVTSAVPEPGTWAMLLGGIGLLFGYQRLRNRRA